MAKRKVTRADVVKGAQMLAAVGAGSVIVAAGPAHVIVAAAGTAVILVITKAKNNRTHRYNIEAMTEQLRKGGIEPTEGNIQLLAAAMKAAELENPRGQSPEWVKTYDAIIKKPRS